MLGDARKFGSVCHVIREKSLEGEAADEGGASIERCLFVVVTGGWCIRCTGGGRPPRSTALSHEIILAEEEISDVSLATFYVFDKEDATPKRVWHVLGCCFQITSAGPLAHCNKTDE